MPPDPVPCEEPDCALHGPAVTFLDAMIPAHVQEELSRSIPPCPNQPACEHNGLVHEINDWDDPSPRCCMDGCGCGALYPRSEI